MDDFRRLFDEVVPFDLLLCVELIFDVCVPAADDEAEDVLDRWFMFGWYSMPSSDDIQANYLLPPRLRIDGLQT